MKSILPAFFAAAFLSVACCSEAQTAGQYGVLRKNTGAGYTTTWHTVGGNQLFATDGNGVLTPINKSAFLTPTGSGGALTGISWSQIGSRPTTLNGYGITDGQPFDSDLSAIGALSTTAYGRGFLTLANSAAGWSYLGLGTLASASSVTSAQVSDATSVWTGSADDGRVLKIGLDGVIMPKSVLSPWVRAENQMAYGADCTFTYMSEVCLANHQAALELKRLAFEDGVNVGTATNITGLLKGFDGGLDVAEAGTDYLAPGGVFRGDIADFGTGVATALGVNTGSAGAFIVNGGAAGVPSSITLTNATGLPLTTGVTGVLSGANGGTGRTDYGGVGHIFVGGNMSQLGTLAGNSSTTKKFLTSQGNGVIANTPAWGTITSSDITGLGTGVATALGVNTGSAGAFIVNGGAAGVPSSITLTNATGLPLTTGVTGQLQSANLPTLPILRAAAATNQSVSNSAYDQIVFGTTVFSQGGTFTSNVFAPNVAGYYRVRVESYPNATPPGTWMVEIRKNAFDTQSQAWTPGGNATLATDCIVYLNGSTDYVQAMVLNQGGGTLTLNSGRTRLEVSFLSK